MAVQTSFADELTWAQDCNHCLLALRGNDSELDLALLDVEDRVRDLALREDNFTLLEFGYCFPLAGLGEKYLGSNKASVFLLMTLPPLPVRLGDAYHPFYRIDVQF